MNHIQEIASRISTTAAKAKSYTTFGIYLVTGSVKMLTDDDMETASEAYDGLITLRDGDVLGVTGQTKLFQKAIDMDAVFRLLPTLPSFKGYSTVSRLCRVESRDIVVVYVKGNNYIVISTQV